MQSLIGLFLIGLINQTNTYTTHASYYGPGLYGNKMANGELFTKHTIAIAHRNYKFGTKLLITNLNNGKKLVAAVKDRGPFVDKKKRTLDISYAGALQLGMLEDGVIPVRVRKLN